VIKEAIINGEIDKIEALVKKALKSGVASNDILK